MQFAYEIEIEELKAENLRLKKAIHYLRNCDNCDKEDCDNFSDGDKVEECEANDKSMWQIDV